MTSHPLEALTAYNAWMVHWPDQKNPRNKRNKPAGANDPDNWMSYGEALELQKKYGVGLGFVPSPSDPFTCIDLDTHKTNNPAIIKTHAEIEQYANSYSEFSPSGRGTHIWFEGKIPSKNLSSMYMEVYSNTLRYITVTFNAKNQLGIRKGQSFLEEFKAHFYPSEKSTNIQANAYWEGFEESIPPSEWLQKIAENMERTQTGEFKGDYFVKLYNGIHPYPSASEAHLAFCNILASHTNDKNRVLQCLLSSPLGQHQKIKNRPDYVKTLIDKSFDSKKLPSDPSFIRLLKEFEQSTQTNIINFPALNQSAQLPPKLHKIPNPGGLVGQVADYILANARKPNVELSIAGALGFMAAICGRVYQTPTHSGLNLYITAIGYSGTGKEVLHKGLGTLRTKLQTDDNPVFGLDSFFGIGTLASPQALNNHLDKQPSCLLHKGEIGVWMQKVNDEKQSFNEANLRAAILDLYSKSDAGNHYQGTLYADNNKNIKEIISPAFSILGESTPSEWNKALSPRAFSDGLLSRFIVVNMEDAKPTINFNSGKAVISEDLREKMRGLMNFVVSRNHATPLYHFVEQTDEAMEYSEKLEKQYNDYSWEHRFEPTASLWNRANLNILRVASLLSIGYDYSKPTIQLWMYQWAQHVVEDGIKQIEYDFASGNTGEIKDETGDKQRNSIKAMIREFYLSEYRDGLLALTVTKEMHQGKEFSYRWIRSKCTNRLLAFRTEKDIGGAMKRILTDLVHEGTLLEKEVVTGSRNKSMAKTYQILNASALGDD